MRKACARAEVIFAEGEHLVAELHTPVKESRAFRANQPWPWSNGTRGATKDLTKSVLPPE
jgi:hypothetical protein